MSGDLDFRLRISGLGFQAYDFRLRISGLDFTLRLKVSGLVALEISDLASIGISRLRARCAARAAQRAARQEARVPS